MTTAGDALLADILAQPEADDLRLIYADWLDDHGGLWAQPHAVLIRWQISTGAVVERNNDGKWQYLSKKKGKTPADAWHAMKRLCPDFYGGPLPYQGAGRVVFRRGFIAEVECPCAGWLENGPAVAQKHPLEFVRLANKQPMRWESGRSGPDPSWAWYLCEEDSLRESLASGSYLLPPIARHLIGDDTRKTSMFDPAGRKHYPTEEAAHAALSRACIAWARSVRCLRCNDTGEAVLWDRRVAVGTMGPCPTGPCPACALTPVVL